MQAAKFALFVFLIYSIFILSIHSVPVNGPIQSSTKRDIVVERPVRHELAERGTSSFNVVLSNSEVAAVCYYTFSISGSSYTTLNLNCISNRDFCITKTFLYIGQDESPNFPTDYQSAEQGCNGDILIIAPISIGDTQIRFAADVRKYNNFGISSQLSNYRVESDSFFYFKAYPVPPGGGRSFYSNCVDRFHFITPGNTYYNCWAYSFQDPNIPVIYSNMNSVNWLINQKLHGNLDNNQYDANDVQYAIWLMVHPDQSVPIPWSNWSPTDAYYLRDQALQHSDWVPTLDTDYDSIVVFCGDQVQDTMYHVQRGTAIAFEGVSLVSNVGNIKISGYAYNDCINNDVLDDPYYPVENLQITITYSGVTITTLTTDSNGYYEYYVQVPVTASPSYVLTLVNSVNNLTPRTTQVSTGSLLSGATHSFTFFFFDTAGDNNVDGIIDTCYCTTISSTDGTCDNVDDNCNGFVDESYTPVSSTCGFGPCATTGVKNCESGSIVDTCKPDLSKVSSDANCNGVDENCDGTADNNYVPPTTSCGLGVCATTGKLICSAGSTSDTCVPDLTKISADTNCNLIDEDCDGTADEDYVPPTTSCGLGVCANTGNLVCTAGSTVDTCTPLISTLLDNNCNLIDEDCDGPADEDYVPPTTYCGLGVCATTGKLICSAGSTIDTCIPDTSKRGSDNNCDGLDNDCDGQVDEDYVGPVTSCGLGVCGNTGTLICVNAKLQDTCVPDFTKRSSDNNCNGVDNDCDGGIDEDYLSQITYCGNGLCANHGFTKCNAATITDDCSPNNILKAASDNTCDGVDNDCDGQIDEDYVPTTTTCGFGSCRTNGRLICQNGRLSDTCVADTSKITSDANCDGIDNDCDGVIDDNFISTQITCGEGSCRSSGARKCVNGAIVNDCTALISTLLDNNCNGIDEDCDGTADEDYVGPVTTCGTGACKSTGNKICVNGQLRDTCVSDTSKRTSDANCDGIDNDCNGFADDGFVSQSTTCGSGVCKRNGVTSCVAGSVRDSCSVGSPTAASDNTCNGVDEDCDGTADEDYSATSITCGVGACANTGTKECKNGVIVNECSPLNPAANDMACDGIDNDCDGRVDEDFVSSTTSCGIGSCQANGFTICQAGTLIDTCSSGSSFPEICDGIDNDCDNLIDEGYPVSMTCGVGACAATGLKECISGNIVDQCTPGTPAADDSVCDGIDNDCDGQVDEDFSPIPTTCGIGGCQRTGFKQCISGSVVDVCNAGSPSATDNTCNGVDDNCNGQTDEGYVPTPTTCGTGVCASTGQLNCDAGKVVDSCTAGSANGKDNDCNGADDNCDGRIDENFLDTVTYCTQGLCSDDGLLTCSISGTSDSCVIVPTTTDGSDPCDGIDNDCDGQVDEDYTPSPSTCGVGACAATGTNQCVNGFVQNICTPLEATVSQDLCDGIDNDCDGLVDEDFESTTTSCGNGVCQSQGVTSCVAGQLVDSCVAGTSTATSDLCDGLDNDCDGRVDEDYTPSPSSCGVGACGSTGTYSCVAGVVTNVCTPLSATTTSDLCDGIDNDCDGLVDEDFVQTTTSCGNGVCASSGLLKCIAGRLVDSCVAGTSTATSDLCDGLDNDCDGQVDEDYVETTSTCGIGACGATGLNKCVGGVVRNICTPKNRVTVLDQCDGIDNDCDGITDEDFKINSVFCGKGVCKATGFTKCEGGRIVENCIELPPQSINDPCDGFDNDCDGSVDEDFESITTTCGVGACQGSGSTSCVNGVIVDSCVAGPASSLDDNCDGIDDNCNGQTDEGYVPTTTNCGTGACATTGTRQCFQGTIVDSCVPQTPTPDTNCDGVDNDCDGRIDEDYQPTSIQCGAICSVFGKVICTASGIRDTCIIPSSIDFCDGQDNDCDGYVDEDARDRLTTCGFGVCVADGVEECIDGNYQPFCTPLEPQSSVDDTCDGLDNNCDGEVDEGFVPTSVTCGLGVCQRSNTTSCTAGTLNNICTPGQPQSKSDRVCDGLDNDCDGEVDEDYVNFPITCGVGYCKATGYQVCEQGKTVLDCTAGSPLSSDNTCDGVDDNCDGEVDEGFVGTTITCGQGECFNTMTSQCTDGTIDNICTPLDAPATSDVICDGKDNDCDGEVDEDYVKESITCGIGACLRNGEKQCTGGVTTEVCTAGTPAPNDAICNGIDDNCNGEVDEGFQPFQGSEYCDVFKCNKKTFICVGGNIVDNCATYEDSDRDGVPDNCDRCAGFDDFVDSDKDTVPDGCDVCKDSDDLEDVNQDGIPDGCNDICGLGIYCDATDGCQPTLPLDCTNSIIRDCAVFECVANGCQSQAYSSNYVLNHYFTLTTEGAYDLYRVRESTDFLIGSGKFESKDTYWVGLSFNSLTGDLFGIDSTKVLQRISTYDGSSTKAVDLSTAVKGEPIDIAFHPDGTLSVLSLASADQYEAYVFRLPSTNPIFSSAIERNDYDLRAITWDSFGYYLYMVDSNGSYYQVERSLSSSTTVTSMCFSFTKLQARNVSPTGLAISVNGTLLTGWRYDTNKIAYSQIDSRDCIGKEDYLQRLSITSASVAYTAIESCVRSAGVTAGGNGGGGNNEAFPGETTNNVLENYPTTAVATAVAGGFLGLCAIFAVLIAVNSTKSKEEVPLDTILDTSEASAVTHDNAIYLNGVSSVQNTMYQS